MAFQEIPILDMSLARDDSSKPEFLKQLQDALLHVGFLYIKNTGIDQELYDQVCEQGIRFFDLPDDEKLRIEMKNAKSFLGYSRVCNLSSRTGLWKLTMEVAGQRDNGIQGRLARTGRSEHAASRPRAICSGLS